MKQFALLFAFVLIALGGCSREDRATLEFRVAEENPGPGLTEFTAESSSTPLYLHESFISEADVDSTAVISLEGQTGIAVLLKPEAAQRLAEVTEQNVGKRCCIILNGKLVSSPRILDPIRGGRAVITADLTEAQAKEIARQLR